MIDPKAASFRDPDAQVIKVENTIYRIVFDSYKENYDLLKNSGLKEGLVNEGSLIKEQELPGTHLTEKGISNDNIYKILEPQIIPFISYPYEWSFTQLKSAALLTLDIQKKAIEKGLILKDATAYNVQFISSKSVFIDSTSFEKYTEGLPWMAYGQFCRHFLGPLLLYKYGLSEVAQLQKAYLDGIPLGLVSKVLPRSSKFNFSYYSHIHYHAKLEAKYSQDISFKSSKIKISKNRLLALITHLKQTIENIDLPQTDTQWTNYYQLCSYDKDAFESKKTLVTEFLGTKKRNFILDLGCNEGEFSHIASKVANYVVSVDLDHMVIDQLTRKLNIEGSANILPLVIDISNPSPGIGWLNKERETFIGRCNFDTVFALALVHHLAIGNNLPLEHIADFFARITNELIIEFVPKEDKQTQRLLVTKVDIFNKYTLDNFRIAFKKHFQLVNESPIISTNRTLFLFRKA